MSWYRRRLVPGGTFFFTVRLQLGTGVDLRDHVEVLRDCYGRCARERPFRTEAIVMLPDHLHAVWTLPEGDADFSGRWRRIKAGVSRRVGEGPRVPPVADGATRGLPPTLRPSASKRRKGEAGVWQRRFWERQVRDEAELAACLRYVWCNPVKHGLVEWAVEWPWSSVHREIAAGRLPVEGP
ncbi:transposase [Jannaschia sp. Os4]|uniref:REP-associated tyrosine transposase n=1 Tax=Jannaschia sp. Os4 TaxID=2807617 RepID=UPI00193A3A91|nr:transposase [Jannaschia sp. Os4]MBM2577861.1 transposase [Jannaschia sp. Os4]